MPNILRRLSQVALLLVGATLAWAPVASAGTLATWSGAGANGLWSTAGNWTGTAPVGSGTSSLTFAGTTNLTSTNDLSNLSIDSLSFTNTTTNFVLSGNAITLAAATISTTTTGSTSIAQTGDILSLGMVLSGSNRAVTGAFHNLSFTGTIGGTGSLTYDGAASFYVSGNNSYSGGTFITGGSVWTSVQSPSTDPGDDHAFGTGTVIVSGSGSLLARNGINLANAIVISGTGNGNFAGAIRGSYGSGTSTSTISGSVTLAGNAQINSASSVASDTGSKLLFTNTVDIGSNTLTLVAQGNAQSQRSFIEFTGDITGSGAVIVANGTATATSGTLNGQFVRGVVIMSSSNSYTGGTTLTRGVLRVTDANGLGTGPLAVNGNGLEIDGVALNAGALSGSSSGVISTTTSGTLVTTSTTSTTYDGTIVNGTAGGLVGLTKAGSGSLTLTGSNGYTGTTRVDGGILALGSATALAGTGTIGFGGGTLQYSASNQVDYSARFADSGSAIAIDTNGQTVTFASAIAASNTAGLTKSGSGTLFLNGTNLFTGTTTVASGTLAGAGSVVGPVAVNAAAVLAPGATLPSTGVLGVGGLILSAADSRVVMAVTGTTAGTTYDQILFSGVSAPITYNGILDLSLSGSYATGTTFDLFEGFTANSGHFTTLTFAAAGSPYENLAFQQVGTSGVWKTGLAQDGVQYLVFNEGTGQLVVVPEPGTLAMVGMAVAMTAVGYWRRRRAG
jgi:fibronectin-binding autotransporter adhesin